MNRWPASLPDYAWPESFGSPAMVAARLVMACVFHLAHLLGRIVGCLDRRMDRVLIIRTDGLGDALLFEPAIRNIATAMRWRRIHLWAPQLTCELLANCPSIERLMVIPRGFKQGNLTYFVSTHWRFRLGFALGRWKFDKVIYPVQSPEPLGNWLLASSRSFEKWLNVGDTINQFDWQRFRAHESATRILERLAQDANVAPHELLQNEFLARQCNAEEVDHKPRLYFDDESRAVAREKADSWRRQSQELGGRELVAVIPAASMSLNAYPDAGWVEALGRLWEQHRAVPVLMGGPDDGKVLQRFARELSHRHIPSLILDPPLRILEMSALLGELDGVISVDTGVAHVAVAQHVPTVVLVGGGNPGRFFPWPDAPHHVALNVPMPCDGCNNRCMFQESACITLITPDQIVGAYAHLKARRFALQLHPANQPLRAAG